MREFPATCFVVDDDASVRQSLTYLLKASGYHVEDFDSAEAFLAHKLHGEFGCIITDVKMPGMSGLDLQDNLERHNISLPIIFITGHGDLPMGVRAMKKGAVDFLTKPFDDSDLISAITAALERCRAARKIKETAANARDRFEMLSSREHDILRQVIAGKLNKEIAYDLGIALQTVKIHRGRLMKKLAVDSLAELVRLADQAGITPGP